MEETGNDPPKQPGEDETEKTLEQLREVRHTVYPNAVSSLCMYANFVSVGR